MVDQIPARSPSFSRTLADCNGVWPSIRWFTDKGMSDDAKSLIERDLRSSVRIDNEKRRSRLSAKCGCFCEVVLAGAKSPHSYCDDYGARPTHCVGSPSRALIQSPIFCRQALARPGTSVQIRDRDFRIAIPGADAAESTRPTGGRRPVKTPQWVHLFRNRRKPLISPPLAPLAPMLPVLPTITPLWRTIQICIQLNHGERVRAFGFLLPGPCSQNRVLAQKLCNCARGRSPWIVRVSAFVRG